MQPQITQHARQGWSLGWLFYEGLLKQFWGDGNRLTNWAIDAWNDFNMYSKDGSLHVVIWTMSAVGSRASVHSIVQNLTITICTDMDIVHRAFVWPSLEHQVSRRLKGWFLGDWGRPAGHYLCISVPCNNEEIAFEIWLMAYCTSM